MTPDDQTANEELGFTCPHNGIYTTIAYVCFYDTYFFHGHRDLWYVKFTILCIC